MAGNFIVTTNKFTPFTYDDFAKPLTTYKEDKQKAEEEYTKLGEQAALFEGLINLETDKEAARIYQSYIDDLKAKRDILYKYGVDYLTDRDISNMKIGYNSKIKPIELAYTSRAEQAKKQQEEYNKDSSVRFNREAATTSLDDYLKNPNLNYKSISGNKLVAESSAIFSNLAKSVREDPRHWREILGKSYYEAIERSGYNPEEILSALENTEGGQRELNKVLEQLYKANDIDSFDSNIQEYAKENIALGIWSAIGQNKYTTLDNWRAKMEEKQTQNENDLPKIQGPYRNPRNYYSSKERSEYDKAVSEVVNKDKYISINPVTGKYELTDEGKSILAYKSREMNPKDNYSPFSKNTGIENGNVIEQSNKIKKLATAIGVSVDELKNMNYEDINKALENYGNKYNKAVIDMEKDTEWLHGIDSSIEDELKKKMLVNHNEGFNIIDFDSKNGKYRNTGDTISYEDFADPKTKLINIVSSSKGLYVEVNVKGEKAVKIPLDVDINSTALNNAIRSHTMAKDTIERYKKLEEEAIDLQNKIVNGDKSEETLKKLQEKLYSMQVAKNKWNEYIDSAHSNIGTFISTFKTKPEEFLPLN